MTGLFDDLTADLVAPAARPSTGASMQRSIPSSGGLFGDLTADLEPNAPAVSPSGGPGAISRGFVSGLRKGVPESIAGAAEMVGLDTVGQKLRDLAATSPEAYKQRVPTIADIPGEGAFDTASRAATFAGEQIGQGVASTLPSIAAAGIGAVAGMPAGPIGAAVGGIAGAAGSSYVLNAGDLYNALIEEGADKDTARKWAALGGIPIAGLDVTSLGMIGKAFTGPAKQAAYRGVAKRILTEAGKGAATEGATEGAQQTIQDAIVSTATGTSFATNKNAIDIATAAAGGALTGGAMRAPAGIRRPPAPQEAAPASAGPQAVVGPPQAPVAPPAAPQAQGATATDQVTDQVAPPIPNQPASQPQPDASVAEMQQRGPFTVQFPQPAEPTPLDRATAVIERMEPGQPVPNRFLAQMTGVRPFHLDGIRTQLAERGLIAKQGNRWVRATPVAQMQQPTMETIGDTQGRQQVRGQVGDRSQETGQLPDQTAGGETTATGRILQAQEGQVAQETAAPPVAEPPDATGSVRAEQPRAEARPSLTPEPGVALPQAGSVEQEGRGWRVRTGNGFVFRGDQGRPFASREEAQAFLNRENARNIAAPPTPVDVATLSETPLSQTAEAPQGAEKPQEIAPGLRRITGNRSNPVSLIEFIAANGGIRDTGGNLAASDIGNIKVNVAGIVSGIGAKQIKHKGFQQLVREDGRDPDDMALLAYEHGFIPSRDPNLLTDAIIQDEKAYRIGERGRGDRIYGSDNDAQEMRAKVDDDRALDRQRGRLEDIAEEYGIEYDAKTSTEELQSRIDEFDRLTDEDEAETLRRRDEVRAETPTNEQGDEFDIPFEPSDRQRADAPPDVGQARRETEAGDEGQPGTLYQKQPGTSAPDERDTARPVTERTDQGDNYVLPGTEQSARQARQSRDDQNQGRIRKGQNKPLDTGLFDTSARDQKSLFQKQDSAPAFYSTLTRAVESLPQAKAPAEQWARSIRNATQRGVKQDEIDWSGVMDWLKERDGKPVTKDDLVAFLKANEVQVREVTKKTSARVLSQADLAAAERAAQRTGDWSRFNELTRIYEDQQLGNNANQSGNETKFAQWQLPGGKNYRELLLTLPPPAWMYPGRRDAPSAAALDSVFTSGHYTEPNVLAHVRFNERTDADGNRVLFIEEIQSDWHQKGRKEGYVVQRRPATLRPGFRLERISAEDAENLGASAGDWIIVDRDGEAVVEITYPGAWNEDRVVQAFAEDAADAGVDDAIAVEGGGTVPDAPFKKTWQELAFKRMLRWAAENGFDKLAWTTGEQQVDRYKEALRTAVDRIKWTKTEDGIHLVGFKNNQKVVDTVERENAISDAIGKAMGDKIIADPNQSGVIEGNDITISDTGMAGFYDKMLRDFASKYGKKWGAKVGTTKLKVDSSYRSLAYFTGWAIANGDTRPRPALAEAWGRGPNDPTVKAFLASKSAVNVHSISITPAMRESVMAGQPMWQRAGTVAPLDTDQRTVSWQVAPDLRADYVASEEWTGKRSEAANVVLDILRPMVRGKNVTLNVADILMGGEGAQAERVLGSYSERTNQAGVLESVVSLAMIDPKTGKRRGMRELIRSLNHEVMHFLDRIGLFDAKEWAVLEKAAIDHGWLKDFDIENRYGDASKKDQIREAISEARGAFAVGDLKLPPGLRRLFARVQEFLDRVKNWLQGNGFQNWRDIMEAVGEGEIGSRLTAYDRLQQETAAAIKDATGDVVTPEEMTKARGSLYQKREQVKGDAAQEATIAKIMGSAKKPIGQRVAEWLADWKQYGWREVRQSLVDQYDAIAQAEKDVHGKLLDAEHSAYKSARMLNTTGQVYYLMHHGMLQYKDGTWQHRDGFDGGLYGILETVAKSGKLRLWEAYAIARRASELKGQERENLLSEDDIDTLLKLGEQHPEFAEVHRKWADFNAAMLDMAEQSGTLSPEVRKLFESREYVPFYRIMESIEKSGGPSHKRGLAGQRLDTRRLEGGKEKINDLVENIVKNLTHIMDSSAKNIAAQKAIDVGVRAGMAKRVAVAEKPWLMSDDQLTELLDTETGGTVDFKTLSDEDKKAFRSMVSVMQPKAKNLFSVMFEGKPRYYTALDPLFLRSIASINWQGFEGIATRLMAGAKNLLTRGVTSFPDFMLRNALRDSASAWVLTGGRTDPFSAAKGFSESLKSSSAMKAIRAAGSDVTGWYQIGPSSIAGELRRVDEGKSTKHFVEDLWHKWEAIGRASDNANRIALYKALRKEGKSVAEAAYQAQDLMDFSMRGDAAAMRWLTTVVPFLNARVQGLYRLGRGVKDDPRSFFMRGGMITAASLALLYANIGEDWYDELPDDDKDNNYHFKMGDTIIRLPKPFEVGSIFSTIPERIAKYFHGTDDGERLATRAWYMFSNTFAMNPIPQLLMPIAEQWSNKSAFTGAPIETQAMRRLMPGERKGANTSAIAEGLGKLAPETISPVRVDALLRGYFGTLGSVIMSASNILSDTVRPGDKPAWRLEDYPIAGWFMRQQPAVRTQFLTDFYDLNREISQVAATARDLAKVGKRDEAVALLKEHPGAIQLSQAGTRIEREIGDINSRIRLLREDQALAGDMKRVKIDALMAQRNAIAKRGYQSLKSTKEAQSR